MIPSHMMTLLLALLERLIPSRSVDLSSVRRVLVVDLNFLGDMILSSPVYRALKRNLPNANIDALVFRFGAPALSGNPYVDRLHVVESLTFTRQLPAAFSLRGKYDLTLPLSGRALS